MTLLAASVIDATQDTGVVSGSCQREQVIGDLSGSCQQYDRTMTDRHELDTPALLRHAAVAGTPLSERMLETFRAQQLIPRPVRVSGVGRTPRWIYPEGTHRQLAAVLHWRTQTKDPGLIRILLWMDGFDVPTGDVQAAVVKQLQTARDTVDRVIRAAAADAGLDVRVPAEHDQAVATVAATVAARRRGPSAIPRLTRVSKKDRDAAAAIMIKTFALGIPAEGDVEGQARLVERVLGISPNGRKQRIADTGPWITGPAAPLLEAVDIISFPQLLAVAESATTAEFEAARMMTLAMFRYLPFLIRFTAAIYDDPNYIGMASAARLDADPGMVALLLPAIVSITRTGWETVSPLADALGNAPTIAARTEHLLDMPQRTLSKNLEHDPQMRAQVDRVLNSALNDELGTPTPSWTTPADGHGDPPSSIDHQR